MLYICKLSFSYEVAAIRVGYQGNLTHPHFLRNRNGGFLSMKEGDYSDMTDLHFMAYKSVLNVRLVHLQIDLAEVTKVLSYVTGEEEAFPLIVEMAGEITEKAMLIKKELDLVKKWRK